MKIAGANLQLHATHASRQQRSASLIAGYGPRLAADHALRRAPPAAVVALSPAGGQLSAAQHDVAPAANEGSPVDADPRLSLLRSMIERLTGRRIEVFDARDLHAGAAAEGAAGAPSASSPPPAANDGAALAVAYRESYTEQEVTRFSATGTVHTADGQEIRFSLELVMSRFYHEESSLNLGSSAPTTDPLVLNFSGSAAQLTDQRFAFDLDADGKPEQINGATGGSAFLVFDRNRNGRIDDGRELFGPTHGDGFQELAALDDDGNGWIDGNDAAFRQLGLWTHDSVGGARLATLTAAGVGALSLSRLATPFSVKTDDNTLLGQIRSSGIFLQEDGAAGTIQQIDLTA